MTPSFLSPFSASSLQHLRRFGARATLLLLVAAGLLEFGCISKGATNIGASGECGDGRIQSGEECDDGNDEGGDGCSANCKTVEDGWECRRADQACIPLEMGDEPDAAASDDDEGAEPEPSAGDPLNAGDDHEAEDPADDDSADDDATDDDSAADDGAADDDDEPEPSPEPVAEPEPTGTAETEADGGPSDGEEEEPDHCVTDLFGYYVLRTDGVLLYMPDSAGADQEAILDADTVEPLQGVVDASVGEKHGCAALEDGTAACWRLVSGGNGAGQLGNGDTESGAVFQASRVLTGPGEPLSGVVGVAGNTTRSWNDGSCAITEDGQLYCWGAVAKLVNASDSPYAVPVLADGVAPLTGIVQADISSAGSFCALVQGDSERAAYCWGDNGSGQLGQGHETGSEYPIRVPGLDDPSKVITFGWGVTACAIEGTAVRCWGQNGGGATGTDSTNANVLTPSSTVLADGSTRLEGVVDIVGGSTDVQQGLPGSACALLGDKTVKCWGAGYSAHPENLGVPNVWRLGVIDGKKVRLLTTDGKYHVDGTARDVSCNPI